MSTTWHNSMYLQHHHGLSQADALKVRTGLCVACVCVTLLLCISLLSTPFPTPPLGSPHLVLSLLIHIYPFCRALGLDSKMSRQFVELARMDGVRRMNVLKNVLRPLYAFNALQRMALPDAFRPLEFCCGKVQS
jgi:hypothetical protein